MEPRQPARDDFAYWLQLRQRDGLPESAAAPLLQHTSAKPKKQRSSGARRPSKPPVSLHPPPQRTELPRPPPQSVDPVPTQTCSAQECNGQTELPAASVPATSTSTGSGASKHPDAMPAHALRRLDGPIQPAGPQLVRPVTAHRDALPAAAAPSIEQTVPAAPGTEQTEESDHASHLPIRLLPQDLKVRRRVELEGNDGFVLRPLPPAPPPTAARGGPPVVISLTPRELTVRRRVPLEDGH